MGLPQPKPPATVLSRLYPTSLLFSAVRNNLLLELEKFNAVRELAAWPPHRLPCTGALLDTAVGTFLGCCLEQTAKMPRKQRLGFAQPLTLCLPDSHCRPQVLGDDTRLPQGGSSLKDTLLQPPEPPGFGLSLRPFSQRLWSCFQTPAPGRAQHGQRNAGLA